MSSSIFICPENLHPREHSQFLDQEFGFNISAVEQKLISNEKRGVYSGESRSWVGVSPHIFQTPYSEIYEFLLYFKNIDFNKVVDIGAGYGRIGIVLNALYPNCQFVGIEFVEDRVTEAQRVFNSLRLQNAKMLSQNVISPHFVLPVSDIYFVYDFSDLRDLENLLRKFDILWDKQEFFIVVRGKALRSLIQNKYPQFWRLNGAFHNEHWSIYSSHFMFE